MKAETLLTIFALLTFPLLGISAFIVVYLEHKYHTMLLSNLELLHV